MSEKDVEIERLRSELCSIVYGTDKSDAIMAKANEIARRLTMLIEPPTAESLHWYVHSWTLVCEFRGDIKEAIRIEDLDIKRKRDEIEKGDFDRFPNMLPEDIEYLQSGLYFQAIRLSKLGRREEAVACLQEIFDLSEQHGLLPDQDTQELANKLRNEGTNAVE